VGGKSAVVKDIPPYVIASGDRAKLHGLNSVGLKRHGFSQETLSLLKKAYRIIFRIGITLNEAIERIKAEVEQAPEVVNLIDFIKSSRRGITR
jgi:UDP-N-acetylglucosamine acyltransferase